MVANCIWPCEKVCTKGWHSAEHALRRPPLVASLLSSSSFCLQGKGVQWRLPACKLLKHLLIRGYT